MIAVGYFDNSCGIIHSLPDYRRWFFMENTQSRPKALWNSRFVRICLYIFICQITFSLSNTILPLYVINELGRGNTESGFLGTTFTIASMICRLVSGRMTDKFGRRAMMVVGAAGLGAALGCMGFTRTFLLLICLKAVQGVSSALVSTASNAAASDVIPESRINEGIGYYSLSSTISSAIGPTVALGLMGVDWLGASGSNYPFPLYVAGLLGVVGVVIVLTLPSGKSVPQGVYEGQFHLSDYLEKKAFLPSLLQLIFCMGTGLSTFMIVFANEMDFEHISLFYILSASAAFVVRIGLGKLLNQWNPLVLMLPLLLMMAAATLLLAVLANEMSFLILGPVTGAATGIIQPTFNALALKRSAPERRGAASATFWLGYDLGQGIGMMLGGLIIDWVGFQYTFAISASYVVVFAVICTFFFTGNRKRHMELG